MAGTQGMDAVLEILETILKDSHAGNERSLGEATL